MVLGNQPTAGFWNVDESDSVTHFQTRASSFVSRLKTTAFVCLPEFDNLLVGVTAELDKKGRKFHHLKSRCLRNKGEQAFRTNVHIVWIAAAHAHGYTMCGTAACRLNFSVAQGLHWGRARPAEHKE